MPVDFSAVEEVLGASDSISSDNKGTYSTSTNDAAKLAIEVVKQLFPDYLKNAAKISAGSTKDYGAIADYSLLGNSIRLDPTKLAGRFVPSTSQYFPNKKDGTPDVDKKRTQINFTTEEVLTNANTILHELYHARSGGGWVSGKDRIAAEKQFGVTPEVKSAVNKIANSDIYGVGSRLYSMNPGYLDTEEFMANAATLLDMRDRSAMPESGPLKEKLSTIEKIMTEFPQMAQFIENSRQPDIKSLKSGAPAPGTLGALVETLFSSSGKKGAAK